jgi:hypothetical protein
MIWFWILLGLVLITALLFVMTRQPKKSKVASLESSGKRKPVLMILIDSLMAPPLEEAMHVGKAPALKFLAENGQYFPRLVTSFPTMSISIDSTFLTGELPNRHGIFGLSYFLKEERRMVNFGTGLKETFRFGLKTVLADGLIHLNQKFLSPDVRTIHEELDVPTASINALVYRGKENKVLKAPSLATWLGLLPKRIATTAPRYFNLGALAKIDPASGHDQAIFRYGINDRNSREEITALITSGELPPFTIAYFPKNDDVVHKKGPSAIKGIEKADRELQELLNLFPSWEEAVKSITFVVLGDSGQVHVIPNHKEAYVDLRAVLGDFSIMPIRQKHPEEKDQIVLCVNERMAYIYVMDELLPLPAVVGALKRENRLDLIAWQEEEWIHVISGQKEGELLFHPGGRFRDEYGQTWELAGDLSILELSVDEKDHVEYSTYPDGLSRLAGVMDTAERVIVVTVAPGYEMTGESSPTHKGAAHGSLHHLDSCVPMIICGTDSQPEHLRIIDLKKWILTLVNEKPLQSSGHETQ